MDHNEERKRYWRANLRIVATLLSIWFIVAYVISICLADTLNQEGAQPWGFWMAQQGSIIVFVAIIFAYCLIMDREDKKYHVGEDEPSPDAQPQHRDEAA